MSLVGTRPILQDELQKYELHHRARIAIKPGITGMWQVSGRSDITDFEEVVRLDTEYICIYRYGEILHTSAVLVEMLQLLLRLGTFQLSDIFYNTVGGVLGGLVYYVTMKARMVLNI